MFTAMRAERMQGLHFFSDQASGLEAIVAIHNTHLGPALGGCRYLPYNSLDEAVADAMRLARGMSYKAALAGLEQGGGKAVILRQPHVANRAALFEAFGRCIESLRGGYITAMDSGTSSADMDCIAQQTGHVTSTTEAGDPSPHTALGVLAGIRAAVRARLGQESLSGVRITVQGLGNVGYALAQLLHAEGAELMVSDLDQGKVRLAEEELDAQPLALDAVYEAPCDIFSPCGLGGAINQRSISLLRCAAVAGAANNQLIDIDMADQLDARGILYAPDYVINAGGLLHVALTHRGVAHGEIAARVKAIGERLDSIFTQSQSEGRSPAEVADRQAERIIYPDASG
ncbi:Glu/Leu/Phe/Val dehydrogenase [Pseudomonas neustonica]|uniref:Glu/Leu/Phe/Val dehydrogenase n=1 Tax=Pseudomonas neustonica TaxID=2487346 RepID=A0ABX9XN58_9PSED|nr:MULTISPECIES: Glu/Leu/Phe/Val dehydrogenase dimerization domain-containing protein [Pseudomonas]ROZ85578.1 Glu/Leu/Phe/Val dehydrogenase [Pseudomonas sp. SSM44]ROZ87528.1 Glu/Leu/Phe/Val dehydrogenase [Pseudomonas neustonica]|tara:strand:- start:2221 stop:3252 length:1032 start_codon:yes stop_codon:yes gene_type:complete